MKSQCINRSVPMLLLAALAIGGARGAVAQRQRVTIPEDTVVRARLDQKLSTKDAAVGQRFRASLAAEDRSGLPEGTRFEGVITEVNRPTKEEPAALNMEFRRAILPDGRTVAFQGGLGSLSEEDVRR